jgi:thiamine biosynthesis lipoprotein
MVCRTSGGGQRLASRIGIEDPHHPRWVLAKVPVSDGAVATSGSAHRGVHIVDARSGRAASAPTARPRRSAALSASPAPGRP